MKERRSVKEDGFGADEDGARRVRGTSVVLGASADSYIFEGTIWGREGLAA